MREMVDLTNGDASLLLSNGIAVHGSVNLDSKGLSYYKKYFLESSKATQEASAESAVESDVQSVYINQALNKHNEYRQRHNAPNLKHNPELSRKALKWAQDIASRKVMQNSDENLNGNQLGENIAMFHRFLVNNSNIGAYATKLWYDQIKNYDFSKPGFQTKTGNFTQIVWKESTEFGFGVAKASDEHYYAVAYYYPPGNFIGQFAENVVGSQEAAKN